MTTTNPNCEFDASALARHYSHFRVSERILLTGHSHQAWPDCGFDAQKHAWLDAAEFVDDKWERAMQKAEDVKHGYRRLLNDPDGRFTLSSNTHELLIRFLSALDLRKRPRLVTTDGEFHSIRRQMMRLAEEPWIEIVRVPSDSADDIASRLVDEIDDETAAVLVSSVLFRNAYIVPGIDQVASACRRHGVELLVDTYHHLNAVSFDIGELELQNAFIVGGGYKYLQLGEGNCFMRFPRDCAHRPIVTGWFAEFDDLEAPPTPGAVAYSKGDGRYAGATYDPASHYRASAVFEFFATHGLNAKFLREVSQHQVGLLAEKFDALDLDPALIRRETERPIEQIGGFLALITPEAEMFNRELKERFGISTDFRGDRLRLGPAPYLCDRQLEDAIAALGEIAKSNS